MKESKPARRGSGVNPAVPLFLTPAGLAYLDEMVEAMVADEYISSVGQELHQLIQVKWPGYIMRFDDRLVSRFLADHQKADTSFFLLKHPLPLVSAYLKSAQSQPGDASPLAWLGSLAHLAVMTDPILREMFESPSWNRHGFWLDCIVPGAFQVTPDIGKRLRIAVPIAHARSWLAPTWKGSHQGSSLPITTIFGHDVARTLALELLATCLPFDGPHGGGIILVQGNRPEMGAFVAAVVRAVGRGTAQDSYALAHQVDEERHRPVRQSRGYSEQGQVLMRQARDCQIILLAEMGFNATQIAEALYQLEDDDGDVDSKRRTVHHRLKKLAESGYIPPWNRRA